MPRDCCATYRAQRTGLNADYLSGDVVGGLSRQPYLPRGNQIENGHTLTLCFYWIGESPRKILVSF
jgi:hypothetical protein